MVMVFAWAVLRAARMRFLVRAARREVRFPSAAEPKPHTRCAKNHPSKNHDHENENAPLQNAADLEWPASDPANAGVRGEFLLGIFPPDHGGNHAPTPTPTPATTKP